MWPSRLVDANGVRFFLNSLHRQLAANGVSGVARAAGLNGNHPFPARKAKRNVAGYNVYRADALDDFIGSGQVRIGN